MKILEARAGAARVGLAYGPSAVAFIDRHPGVIDYVEIPFEQLCHSPELASVGDSIPIVLHCASLSVAGFIPPSQTTIAAINRAAQFTHSPWIGEHLAFVSADGLTENPDAGAAPTTLTYTLCPQLSEETVERVTQNLAMLAPQFSVPLILENSPQYFFVPGSTMGMVDFIRQVAANANVDLLLDLTHFLITSLNTGVDAVAEIERLPLERVVEIHVSGLSKQSEVVWDDHANPAPALVFELLEQVLRRAKPRAVTLEYNWSPSFPQALLAAHVDRVRRQLS